MIQVNDDIITSYLSGNATPEEQAALEQWLVQSEENREYFETWRMTWAMAYTHRPADTNVEAVWLEMKQRVQEKPAARAIAWKPYLIKMAAALLLAAGVYVSAQWLRSNDGNASGNRVQLATQTTGTQENSKVSHVEKVNEIRQVSAPVQPAKQPAAVIAIANKPPQKKQFAIALKKKEEVCNNTQCPLEICIVQSFNCDGKEPSMLAHCSILHPNEAAPVQYNPLRSSTTCAGSVKEIRITRTSTGETIVLNESSPVTAQDFFDHITGTKTGALEAGVFEADCDNYCLNQSIRLDNSYGMPVLQ